MGLNREQDFYDKKRAGHTAREIAQQPEVWRKLADYLEERREDISAFMRQMETVPDLRTVFTGAGSSAFIGESMQMLLARETGLRGEAIHTTDMVASPDSTLRDQPTLLVSYSRSGESPESVGALQYAAQRISKLFNIVLVCKENSTVANHALKASNTLVLLMPPESCDQGFAMTSSVSCMALATWCVFGYRELDQRISDVRRMAAHAQGALNRMDAAAQAAAAWAFDRMVFLGCGALRGLAREAAVKMLELTAGEVNSGWDTPTGFRHGPKSVINENTVTVHLLSNLPFTRQYDNDFLREVLAQRGANKIVTVAAEGAGMGGTDMEVGYPDDQALKGEIYPYMMGLLFVQLLALEKSIALGKTTDNPCAGGQVNRVVKGIKIYDL